MKFVLLTFVSCVLLLAGCGGYQAVDIQNGGAGLWRQDVQTVAVPTFDTSSFRRFDEIRLTKAIAQELETRSPYKVAPRETADTLLEGKIVDSRLATISRNLDNAVPQEQLYIVIVDFTWKDLRNGKIIVDRRSFEASSPFYPFLGETDEVGSYLAVEDLAAAIVSEMQSDW
ncbi:MAG: LPS assembly lipoprotein LptE [Planctomycetota bacterium]